MINYSLSTWIANLGVDPLLLFCAFLLAPAFTFLIFLLLFVTVVLEAIFQTLCCVNKSISLNVLATSIINVKVILIISLTYFAGSALSFENQEHYILSKGEQKELTLKGITKYSLGNSEVISAAQSQNKFLIKAKSLGFSDLIIWQGREIKKIQIFVISKTDYLKQIKTAESFKSIGLDIKFRGKTLEVIGGIDSLEIWKSYFDLQKISKLPSSVTVSKDLAQEVILEIYDIFLKEGVSLIDCFLVKDAIECEYSGTKIDEFLEKKITSHYPVILGHNKRGNESINYKLRFKIIQVEHFSQKSLNIGLNKLSSTFRNLINAGPLNLVGKNESLFSGFNGLYELLSEPSQLITIGVKNNLEIGSEIPYIMSSSSNNDVTQWKFAGIRVETLLQEKFQKFLLEYKTSLTKPGDDKSISGSKESSSIYLKEGEFIEIFELNFKTKSKEDEYMPLLGQIPILKHLFSSNGRGESYKQIIGFAKLERN